jgi:hypothetical protein
VVSRDTTVTLDATTGMLAGVTHRGSDFALPRGPLPTTGTADLTRLTHGPVAVTCPAGISETLAGALRETFLPLPLPLPLPLRVRVLHREVRRALPGGKGPSVVLPGAQPVRPHQP